MPFSIGNFFYANYWFSQPYIARGLTLSLLVGGFLLLTIIGIVARIVVLSIKDTMIKKMLIRVSNVTMTMGILGLIYMFFRQQRVAFLAWRFWLLLWWAMFIYYIIKDIIYIVKKMPRLKLVQQEKKEKEKYLPKAK